MPQLPDFLTHYTRSEPFRSLLECPQELRLNVVSGFHPENTLAYKRFEKPTLYLAEREALEQRLHAEFLSLGGRPRRRHPFYLVLGRSEWFERHEGEGLRAFTIPIASIESERISFTYGDSGISYQLHDRTWPHAPPERYRRDHHGRLFLLDEIPELVEREGFPDGDHAWESDRRYDYYLEAQLWDEPPCRVQELQLKAT